MDFLRVENLDLNSKRVLIRQDLNVPIKNGAITSDIRIKSSIPTIKLALKQNAKVILMSHLGRPKEGEFNEEYSLEPIAIKLAELLNTKVRLERNYLDVPLEISAGEVVLLENIRFNEGESKNDETLAKAYANLCDIYVMDAFGASHRAQASTYGVGVQAKTACAGLLLSKELDALSKALENPKRPMVAIVGGSKVSTKLSVLSNLAERVDQLLVGGGIANTFIQASGHEIGKSLTENDLVDTAKLLIIACKKQGGDIPIPADVVIGKEFSAETKAIARKIDSVESDDMIFDIGSESAEQLATIIKKAGTIVWNGPVGVFEFEQFASGTKVLAKAIAESKAFSIAGGGDTLAAIEKFNVTKDISYISTGGGAFLEFLEGKKLPVVEMLESKK